jgi:YD repeat-containing protein
MALRSLQICLIASAVAALHGQPMFEGASGFGGEELKGRPKTVRVEREKLGDKPLLLPDEQSEYRKDGKLSSHKRFVDGKLVANEIFESDAEGHRSAIATRDAEDRVVRTQSFRRLPDQSEEEIDTAGGKQVSRTIRRFDADHRVIELKNISTGGISTIMQFDYDDRGRPVEARVRMEGENVFAMERGPNGVMLASPKPASAQTMRVAIIYSGDKQANVTVYDPTGEIVLQLETTEDGAGNQLDQILFERDPQGKPANSVRVERTDAQGNWTLKTLLERNPRTQADEPVARLHRSIVYY